MAERSKAVDCKSIENPLFVGSNPTFFILFMLFLSEFLKIGIYFLFAVSLATIILFASFRLSTYNPDIEKVSTYECGFDPYGDARNNFDVRFYLVGLLFLVFDLETVFFLPWSVGLSFFTQLGFFGMVDFILELFVGFFYVWKIGVLNWE